MKKRDRDRILSAKESDIEWLTFTGSCYVFGKRYGHEEIAGAGIVPVFRTVGPFGGLPAVVVRFERGEK